MFRLFVEHTGNKDKYVRGKVFDEKKKQYSCPKCSMVWSTLPKKRTPRNMTRCPNECMYEDGEVYSYVEGVLNEHDGLYTCPSCEERWSPLDSLTKNLTDICPYGCLNNEG